jgi:hypothetical protein
MTPLDELDQLPRWQDTTNIPVWRVTGLTWRDGARLVNLPCPHRGGHLHTVIAVGDVQYFRQRQAALHDVRDIVRAGLGDVLDWLQESGTRVYV